MESYEPFGLWPVIAEYSVLDKNWKVVPVVVNILLPVYTAAPRHDADCSVPLGTLV